MCRVYKDNKIEGRVTAHVLVERQETGDKRQERHPTSQSLCSIYRRLLDVPSPDRRLLSPPPSPHSPLSYCICLKNPLLPRKGVRDTNAGGAGVKGEAISSTKVGDIVCRVDIHLIVVILIDREVCPSSRDTSCSRISFFFNRTINDSASMKEPIWIDEVDRPVLALIEFMRFEPMLTLTQIPSPTPHTAKAPALPTDNTELLLPGKGYQLPYLREYFDNIVKRSVCPLQSSGKIAVSVFHAANLTDTKDNPLKSVNSSESDIITMGIGRTPPSCLIVSVPVPGSEKRRRSLRLGRDPIRPMKANNWIVHRNFGYLCRTVDRDQGSKSFIRPMKANNCTIRKNNYWCRAVESVWAYSMIYRTKDPRIQVVYQTDESQQLQLAEAHFSCDCVVCSLLYLTLTRTMVNVMVFTKYISGPRIDISMGTITAGDVEYEPVEFSSLSKHIRKIQLVKALILWKLSVSKISRNLETLSSLLDFLFMESSGPGLFPESLLASEAYYLWKAYRRMKGIPTRSPNKSESAVICNGSDRSDASQISELNMLPAPAGLLVL
ncbi:hypothetical protein J6590_037744 [Homalodisca vitripennis]|nr:hypothetical protein J6590_037744 [Homalodisca vitripennis]